MLSQFFVCLFLHSVEIAAHVIMEIHHENILQAILKICTVFQDTLQKKSKTDF